jgi:hypothetical protein
VDDAALLEIARESGLRQHLHGVDATKAKRLLREFVDALEAALSAQPAISSYVSPQMADARVCTPTLAQPASDSAVLLERVKVAARALVREHKVYAEDVDTLADVVKALEALAAQPAERQGEVWLPVLGVNGFEASNTGQVRNAHTGKTLSQSSSGAGYLKVQFYKDGERIQRNVHRVIAEAFLGLREGMQVNHIDGDKTNNALTNLEWVTKSQNEQHSRYALGNLCSPVFATHTESGETREFASQALAERELGLPRDAVRRCLTRATKSSMGWVFSTHPAAPVGVPDVRVDKQGVRFGEGCWYSHERITGVSADLLNEGKCSITAREYMNWVQKHLAAAPSAPQGVDHE